MSGKIWADEDEVVAGLNRELLEGMRVGGIGGLRGQQMIDMRVEKRK